MPANRFDAVLAADPEDPESGPPEPDEDDGLLGTVAGIIESVHQHFESVAAEREQAFEELNVQTGTPPLVLPGAGAATSLGALLQKLPTTGQRLVSALRGRIKVPNVPAGRAPSMTERVALRGRRILQRLFGTTLGGPPSGGIERTARLHDLAMGAGRVAGRDQIEDLRERVLANIERMQAGNGDARE